MINETGSSEFDPIARMDAVAGLVVRVTRGVRRRLSATLPDLSEGQQLTLTEAWIARELLRRPDRTDKDLSIVLGQAGSQISRALRSLVEKGLVLTQEHPDDGRKRLLTLTSEGVLLAKKINKAVLEHFDEEYESLPASQQRVLQATVDASSPSRPEAESPVVIRAAKPSDWGVILDGAIKIGCDELGWNEAYVGEAARIVAAITNHALGESYELAWVAVRGRVLAGACVLGFDSDPSRYHLEATHGVVAMLFVRREFRKRGIAERLLQRCIASAEALTLYSLSLEVLDRQEDLIGLAKRLKLNPAREGGAGYKFGRKERWREYSLKLASLRGPRKSDRG